MTFRIFQFTALILILLTFASAEAGGNHFILLDEGNDLIKIQFTLPEFEIKAAGDFQKIFTNAGTTTKPGYPELPLYSTFIQVERGVKLVPELKIIDGYKQFDLLIKPAGKLSRDGTIPEPVEKDAEFYSSDNIFPVQQFQISEPMYMRGVKVQQLIIYPFQFSPADESVKILKKAEITLNTTADFEVLERVSKPSRTFEPIYENSILNYTRTDEFQQPAILYICGGSSENSQYFKQLTDWRHRQGFVVYTASTSETGSSTSSIKNYISAAYEELNPPPEFVTLVGDVGGSYNIPTFSEYSDCNYDASWGSPSAGDHLYSQLDDSDLLPELVIGRISIRSESHLEVIVSKILNYEQGIETGSNWHEKAALCSDPGTDSGISPVITNESIQYMMETAGMEDVRTNFGTGNLSTWMRNQLDEGILYFNYRGFYGVSNFDQYDVEQANNGYKLPFVSILTCHTGLFNTENTSFVEYFLRAGTVNSPKGGIAAIGMSGATHTLFNNLADMGIYHGIFVDKLKTAGEALLAGKLALLNTYPNMENNQYCDWFNNYSHLMNLMGDAALQLWTDAPGELYVSHSAILAAGTDVISVSVTDNIDSPLSDVWITLQKSTEDGDDGIFLSTLSDEFGNAVFSVSTDNPGTLHVTASKYNYKPVLSEIEIIESGDVNLGIENEIQLNESQDGMLNPGESAVLEIAVINTGTAEVNDLAVELTSFSPFISIDESQLNIPSLTNGETQTVAFSIALAAEMEFNNNVNFQINLGIDSGLNWGFQFEVPVYTPWLIVEDAVFVSGSGSPGGNSEMVITLKNAGNISTGSFESELFYSGNMDVGFSNSEMTWEEIQPGTTYSSPVITVEIGENTIQGSMLNFNIVISNDGNSNVNLPVTLFAGEAQVEDPLGPDPQGYYIYHSNDTSYALAPHYGWIEIDPNLGGIGTNLNFTDWGNGEPASQTSKHIELPFSVRFYGIEYDEITINSNGWIAFGDSDMESFRNTPVPGPGGPSPMLAVFWDDLKSTEGNGYYLINEENGFIVVEWSEMRTYQYNDPNSFQAIIYSSTIPSPSGDSDIQLQYREFNNTTEGSYPPGAWDSFIHGGHATIGIENHLADGGMQYTYDDEYPEAANPLSNESALLITSRLPQTLIHADTLIGPPGLIVNFSEISNYDADSWQWDFNGDGISDAEAQSVDWTYNDYGIYTIFLQISAEENEYSDIRRNFIHILHYGCTDINAENFDDDAQVDDGSCEFIYGCTDIFAFNYNPDAYMEDGSCDYLPDNDFSIYFNAVDPSIGTGDIRFTVFESEEAVISNLEWLIMGIYAEGSSNTFEAFEMDNPALYIYEIESETNPSASDVVVLNADDLSGEELASLLELPGAAQAGDEVTLPNYIVENHPLMFLDDEGYEDNWTNMVDGILFRADNLNGTFSGSIEVELSESYTLPNPNLYNDLIINMEYYNSSAFNKRPVFDYKIELTTSQLDTAISVSPSYGCNDFPTRTVLPFRITNLHTGKQVKLKHLDKGIFGTGNSSNQDPGYRDCVWERNEEIIFYRDTLATSNNPEPYGHSTFSFFLDFNLDDIGVDYSDWQDNETYQTGDYVKFEEMLWEAAEDILTSIEPNEWFDENDDDLNDNPWKILYPWEDGDEIIIKPWKWFVDGDSYIIRMADIISNIQSLDVTKTKNQPREFQLEAPYPNPFNPSTQFNYYLPYPSQLKINIYDLRGREVQILYDGFQNDGYHLITWKAENLASGIYFVQMIAEGRVFHQKLMLLK